MLLFHLLRSGSDRYASPLLNTFLLVLGLRLAPSRFWHDEDFDRLAEVDGALD